MCTAKHASKEISPMALSDSALSELAEVFRKLGLRSRAELALLAPEGPTSNAFVDDTRGT